MKNNKFISGQENVTKLLIANKADVDTTDKFNFRPLHLTAQNGEFFSGLNI